MEAPLNVGKKPLTEYFQKRMKAMMTRQKTVVMMETMATRNQIEKSNLMIFWTKKRGVKLSLEEELNSSMKSNEKGLIENISRVSLTSYYCFTILTINLIVLGVKIVS